MSGGLGLFLGCLFIGTIHLFVSTREQWNWSRIFKRTLLTVGGIGFLAVVTVAGLIVKGSWWDKRPTLIQTLGGISLGEKRNDILFKYADFKIQNDANPDKSGEHYYSSNKSMSVSFEDGKASVLMRICDKSEYQPSVNGFGCNDKSESIISKFGNRVRISCFKSTKKGGKPTRAYDIVDYGTRYILEEDSLQVVVIATPQTLESMIGANWVKCD